MTQATTLGTLRAGVEGDRFFISIGEIKIFMPFLQAVRLGQFIENSTRANVSVPEVFLEKHHEIFEEEIGKDKPNIHPWSITDTARPGHVRTCDGTDCKATTLYLCDDGRFRCSEHMPPIDATKFIIGQSPNERAQAQSLKKE